MRRVGNHNAVLFITVAAVAAAAAAAAAAVVVVVVVAAGAVAVDRLSDQARVNPCEGWLRESEREGGKGKKVTDVTVW